MLQHAVDHPGVTLLSTLGFLGALRGTLKGGFGIFRWWKDRKNHVKTQFLAMPSVNLHIFRDDGENGIRMSTRAIRKDGLSDLFRNITTDQLFGRAVKYCTPDQPFPSLNYYQAESRLWLPHRDPRQMNSSLQAFNKLFRDAYSTAYDLGHQAQELGYPVTEAVHYLIALCEVTPEGARDMSFVAISARNFRKFGDEAAVALLKKGSPGRIRRIEQLQRAYRLHCEFLREGGKDPEAKHHEEPNHDLCTSCDYLFPRVDVAFPIQSEGFLLRKEQFGA